MSEKQPKLKFEEDKERTATRSPPKKSKVEQSKPKKQKLKQDADKAAEKAQHLRFGVFNFHSVLLYYLLNSAHIKKSAKQIGFI